MYVFGGKVLVLSALARAMNRNGYKVHVSHVSRVFKGERNATKEFIENLGKVLGVTVKEAERILEAARAANKDFQNVRNWVVEEA